MKSQEIPGMPTEQIPINFDQETDEEKLTRLKKVYRAEFGQEAALMKLDLRGIEAALKDKASIQAHHNAIWQHNLEEDQDERRRSGNR